MEATEIQQALHTARLAASHARDVRAAYRKRVDRDDRQRQVDIQNALNRLKRAMEPIRSELARIPYKLRENELAKAQEVLRRERAILLTASDGLQRERRKLWKMQKRKGN